MVAAPSAIQDMIRRMMNVSVFGWDGQATILARVSPEQAPAALQAYERLRRERMTGPQIGQLLGMARSTVGAVWRSPA